jgi:hypothetical protein
MLNAITRCAPAQIVGNEIAGQRVNAMELVVLLFFVLLAAAAAAGLTVDSRDSADWKPTNDGVRAARWD